MALSSVKKITGLEIDTGAARAVEAAGSAKGPRLLGMAKIELDPGLVEEGMIVNPEADGKSLRELWRSSAIKTKDVLLGVSNQGVLVRYAAIPKVAPDKLDNVIRFHAQEMLPISLEAVVMDYQVVGEKTNEEGSAELEILLVAARRDMLDGFLEALKVAGLEAVDIDVSTLSLTRVLPEVALQRTVGVVNVANGLSNILIAENGSPRLARLVSVKVNSLAERLQCPLGSVLNEVNSGDTESEEKYNRWLDSLITEVHSSLSYHQSQENNSPIEALILNGTGARLPRISSKLENELGLPVRIVNPFKNYINAREKTEGTGLEAVEYAISAGLARRGLEGS